MKKKIIVISLLAITLLYAAVFANATEPPDFATLIAQTYSSQLTSAQQLQMLNDYCAIWGYQDQVQNEAGQMIANPETKKHFFNRMVVTHLRMILNNYRRNIAQQAATYDVFLPNE
jgi:hypothetical protein